MPESHIERRQLSDFETVELAQSLIEIEEELARQRQKMSLPKKGQRGFQPVMYGTEIPDIKRTRERVAKKLGIGPIVLQRSLKIIHEAPEELKQEVRAGHVSISRAYNKVDFHPPKHPNYRGAG